MNRSPLNAIAINGDTYVRMSAEALIAFDGALPLTYGNGIQGDAEVQVKSCLPWGARVFPILDADIEADSFLASHIAKGTTVESTANIEIDTEYRTKIIWQPKYDAAVAFQAENAGKPVAGHEIIGTAPIVFDSDFETNIKPSPWGSGTAYVRLESRLNPRVSRSHGPALSADIVTSAWGKANLRMHSPSGSAYINVLAGGSLRLGGKSKLSGTARIIIEARGKSDKWRQVYAGGTADIRILFEASGVGRPPIPEHYVPAHPHWRMTVAGDDWRFVVPKDRRRLP